MSLVVRFAFLVLTLCATLPALAATIVSVAPLESVVGQPVVVSFDLTDADYVYGFRVYQYGSRLVAFLALADTPQPPQGIRRVSYPIGGLAPGRYTLEVYAEGPSPVLLLSTSLGVSAPQGVPALSQFSLAILALGVLAGGLTKRSRGPCGRDTFGLRL